MQSVFLIGPQILIRIKDPLTIFTTCANEGISFEITCHGGIVAKDYIDLQFAGHGDIGDKFVSLYWLGTVPVSLS